jgi:hypothetical protein
MIDFKGHRFEKEIILICVRWYLAYPLSYRNLEEMMAERGVEVDHTNIYRWVPISPSTASGSSSNLPARRTGATRSLSWMWTAAICSS